MFNEFWIKYFCNSNLLFGIIDGGLFLKNNLLKQVDQINDSTNQQINIHQ